MKRCFKCKNEKEYTKFHKNKSQPDGYATCCKECFKSFGKQQRIAHAKENQQYFKQYNNHNRESLKQKRRACYVANPTKYKEQQISAWTKNYEQCLLWATRSRAKKKNIPFDLTIEDIIVPTICPILHIPLVCGVGLRGVHDGSPSIDRHIPNLGYVKGNITIISHKANRIKNNATVEELRAVLSYVETFK